MDWSSVIALGLSLAASFAAASPGAIFRPGAWYAGLAKPGWTPPNWAFPVVWAVLFTAMAVAAWLVWEAQGPAARPVLALYGAHLVVNAAWSWLFFGLRRMDLALADVALLWAMIAGLIAAFWPISPAAALLLVPYLVWVTIAAALNLRMLQLNPA